MRYFLRVFDIAMQRRLSNSSQIMVVKTLKNSYCLQAVTFKISQAENKTKIQKEKPKVTY